MKATPTAISAAASSEGSSGIITCANFLDEGAALQVAGVGADHREVDRQRRQEGAEDEDVEGRFGGDDPRRLRSLRGRRRRRPAGRSMKVSELTSRSCRPSRKRSQPARIEMRPISAAGVPPSRTMARTRARKLPEIFRRDSVSIDMMSLKAEKPSRMPKRARFQLAFGACQTAAATTPTRPSAKSALLNRVGRSFFMDRAWAGRRDPGSGF